MSDQQNIQKSDFGKYKSRTTRRLVHAAKVVSAELTADFQLKIDLKTISNKVVTITLARHILERVPKDMSITDGYIVFYANCYVDWCPDNMFDTKYAECDCDGALHSVETNTPIIYISADGRGDVVLSARPKDYAEKSSEVNGGSASSETLPNTELDLTSYVSRILADAGVQVVFE